MIKKRINSLRNLMKQYAISAYLIPGTDPHQNEYIPDIWKRLEWISGFTGSNGNFVITKDKAALWTDYRYKLQAEEELAGTEIIIFISGVPDTPTINEWLFKEFSNGTIIGIDPRLFTLDEVTDLKNRLKHKKIEIKCIEKNLVDLIWKNKPDFPDSPITLHPISYCGVSFEEKLSWVRERMMEEECDLHIITSLDSIAWLFNIRGSDIPYNPVIISYALITYTQAYLFIKHRNIPKSIKDLFYGKVKLLNYNDFDKELKDFIKNHNRIWVDAKRTNFYITSLIEPFCELFFKESPIIGLKAIKNKTEISCLKKTHLQDGIAMVRFLCWLESQINQNRRVTELSAADKLESIRQDNENYIGLSFKTISAFAEHGAIVHYSCSNDSDIPLKQPGIFLIDSGAQYLDGTTDITRTIALGTPTFEQKKMFTLVLKGHIGLAITSFPAGTKGIQLDTIARKPLWDKGLDYGHGTGHGIGFYLNVHEGPQAISQTKGVFTNLEPGMVCSIEPGFYKTGEYGIRIENICLITEDREFSTSENKFYKFVTFTLCPIDRNLIEKKLLTQIELDFLNSYHKIVRSRISPYLDEDELKWLIKATEII